MQWRAESERWRKAHDAVASELRTSRGLIDTMRAYLRKTGQHEAFVEFLLEACLGEEPAAKLLAEIRAEKPQR